MHMNTRQVLASLILALGFNVGHASSLPELDLDLKQTTVSGISSGAFMAVQLAVARSASIIGVAATAGGPYFCALDDSLGGAGASKAIARCMQGDPMYGSAPITGEDLAAMTERTKDWAGQGRIDPVENLARQAVWVFHGYNDGVVKLPVSDALINWYGHFTPGKQIFHKDSLNSGHAQISAACGETAKAASCNPCPVTGGSFINNCADQPAVKDQRYDAAGAALQMFYGPLTRTDSQRLSARPQVFSQLPYLKKRDGKAVGKPDEIAMGEQGYVYVPQACAAGQSCRLHIAFHGCKQSVASIDTAFVDNAGVNEWADANRIVVLYPQAMPTLGFGLPTNPSGCWDWWGYNDGEDLTTLGSQAGFYATRDGVQLAAVWRMAEHLARGGKSTKPAPTAAPVVRLHAPDHSASQAVLRWQPVAEASAYQLYRAGNGQTPVAVGSPTSLLFLVDTGLAPSTQYTYTVRALVAGKESADSNAVSITTARRPPVCDPYFSMVLGQAVKNVPGVVTGLPTTETCQ